MMGPMNPPLLTKGPPDDPPGPSPTPPAKGYPVADDLTCVRCGYNLRGLASDGRCPECGETVERSLRGFPLVSEFTRALRLFHIEFLLGAASWGLVFTGIGMILALPAFPFVRGWMIFSMLVLARASRRARIDGLSGPANVLEAATWVGAAADAAMLLAVFAALAVQEGTWLFVGVMGYLLAIIVAAWVRTAAYGSLCARLADRAERTETAGRLRAFLWMWVLGGVQPLVPWGLMFLMERAGLRSDGAVAVLAGLMGFGTLAALVGWIGLVFNSMWLRKALLDFREADRPAALPGKRPLPSPWEGIGGIGKD
jgi:hypothetical protein